MGYPDVRAAEYSFVRQFVGEGAALCHKSTRVSGKHISGWKIRGIE
ncbi:hypothetical protein FACS1894184_19550 [Clostridia bacterium]|nr:hypothetical protein FACS1894184_19550 [Clostridia bacterium]